MATFTSTLPDDMLRTLSEKAEALSVPKNKLNIKNYKGNPVLSPTKKNGLKNTSEVLVFHIRSVSKDRLINKVGDIEKSDFAKAIKTLNEILTY